MMPAIPEITPPISPYDITAAEGPQIDNYYYTIHFERDSIQINTLEMSPEKFAKAFQEFMRRNSLASSSP